eukprot:CFRG3534T1
MVKFFNTTHTYEHPWEDISYAFLRKYPNPFSSHVVVCDVIERLVDEQGRLVSQRLLEKTNNKPKLAEVFLGKEKTHGFVLEDSVIDAKNKTMKTVTRNLTFSRILFVEETCEYTVSPENTGYTRCVTSARIVCPMWGWARPVEGVGVARFKQNVHKAREALEHVVQAVRRGESMLVAHRSPNGSGSEPTSSNE